MTFEYKNGRNIQKKYQSACIAQSNSLNSFQIKQNSIKMFKLVVAVSFFIAVTLAHPQSQQDKDATLVSSVFADDGAGNVNYAFESSNGIKQQASGQLKEVADSSGNGQQVKTEVLTGSYSYTAPDGTPITITWVADENGYQPQGDHIPKGP
ncbi:hypothetical protein ACKWTF_013830 [Chironomus riparius]